MKKFKLSLLLWITSLVFILLSLFHYIFIYFAFASLILTFGGEIFVLLKCGGGRTHIEKY